MPGGFSNPIVAGLELLIQAIRSPNFVTGVSGWTINKDGSAEFNNLTIRGTFAGTDFLITSAGVFFYSSTPANGNLVLSLAWNGGTDSFGNTFPSGLSVLNHGGANASGVVVGFNGTQPLIYFNNPVPNVRNAPALFVNANGSGTGQFSTMVITSDEDNTQTDFVAINLDGSSEDGTHNATITDAYLDPSSVFHALLTRSLAGCTMNGSVVGVQPGTGTGRSTPLVPETWHTASLSASFTTGGGDQAPRYRFEGIGGGLVRLDGVPYSTAATLAGANIFTLPAGYRPTHNKHFTAATDAAGNALGNSVITVNTAGAVSLTPSTSAAGQFAVLDNLTFPID